MAQTQGYRASHASHSTPGGLPLEGTSRRYALPSWRESPSGLRMSLMEMLQILIPWVWGTASESAGLSSSQVRPRLLGPSCAQSSRDRAQAFCLVLEAAQSHSPPPSPERGVCSCSMCVLRGDQSQSPQF